MEVKTEPLDLELNEKYRKLQQNYARLEKEMVELRKENAELKNEMIIKNVISKEQIAILNKELTKLKVNRKMERLENSQQKHKSNDLSIVQKENVKLKEEMAIKDVIFKQQIATLNQELSKMKRHNRELELEKQQSQKSMVENSQNSTDGLPTEEEETQNDEFTSERMMLDDQMDHQQLSQNSVYIFDSAENSSTIIKRELENAEMGTNSSFQFQIPTTSSALNLNDVENCDEQNQNGVEGLEKIEWDDEEEESGSPSVVEMDLDDGEGEGQISLKDKMMKFPQSGKEDDIEGQIKYAPIKIGNFVKCNWPGCEYRTKKNMKSHWRTHTGERPYVCEECGQSFTYTTSFKRHALIHTGEKPYQCDECGKLFRQPGGLSAHKLTHTNERPYVCEQCGQAFAHSSGLKKHKQIHTGERPITCRRMNSTVAKAICALTCSKCYQIFMKPEDLEIHKRQMKH